MYWMMSWSGKYVLAKRKKKKRDLQRASRRVSTAICSQRAQTNKTNTESLGYQ